MTATNKCYNFVGFRCRVPSWWIVRGYELKGGRFVEIYQSHSSIFPEVGGRAN